MEFIEKFESHKRYVFDKEIYIEHMLSIGEEYSGKEEAEELWTNNCNNKFVKVNNPSIGEIRIDEAIFGVAPQWCREVPSIRVLTEDYL